MEFKVGTEVTIVKDEAAGAPVKAGDKGVITKDYYKLGDKDHHFQVDLGKTGIWYFGIKDFVEYVEAPAPVAEGTGKGMKFDGGKPRMDLLSKIFVEGVAQVLTFGAKKYAAHNWRNGIEQSRLIGAAMRHLFAYNNGEDKDPESGLSHLDHLGCCIMFLKELSVTHPHLDDRYKPDAKK